MKSFLTQLLLLLMITCFVLCGIGYSLADEILAEEIPAPEWEEIPAETSNVCADLTILRSDIFVEEEQEEPVETYSDYEIALMARVVRAEAGNQDEVGKQLVVDCILNRLDSANFPSTIEEVVTQKNQFSSYKWYTEDDVNAVVDEISNRTDTKIVFFRRDHFHSIGTPAYKHGDHYFSTL